MADELIIFVCTGNVCRSPMAEYMLRARLGQDSGWEVRSAGLSALSGMRASESAVQVMREAGIDLRPHRSHELTREWIDAASLIVVMTSGHREQLRDMASQATYKVSLLKSFNPAAKDEDIADPIGSTGQTYRTVRDEIAAALPGLIAFMKTLRKPKASG